ncbi:heavy metal-associated isoprenylated plant protein 3-like [Heracleum sosnowskyi]|uniref:Heavy metal-associated isoprenylated plant protein 3-like n=1 Tax=Heracleum sosnowskyi TaxID=360622 RepID=A0AAD8IUI3_9APIA|nr:heavy metal-associated isoprenylated plant protein 3-like [Heracleum sosnowskyi]
MGEEAKQEQEQVLVETKVEEEKTEEEKKEEPLKPPSPCVLFVDLHCVGCAKKIEKSILRMKGVEGVVISMGQNQVTIKGIVETQAICMKIMKKTKRMAKVLSPLPAAEGEPLPEVVASQVDGLSTVELNVNMHCEACALQLKKMILKMKGVKSVETELSCGKVMVTGSMDEDKLVHYIYRRTRKHAKVVPQPEPEKPQEEATKPEEEKPPAPEEKKEESGSGDEKKEGDNPPASPPPPVEEKKDGGDSAVGEAKEEEVVMINTINDEQIMMQRLMYSSEYYQPMYMIEKIPPAPQLFSDENPNACIIS